MKTMKRIARTSRTVRLAPRPTYRKPVGVVPCLTATAADRRAERIVARLYDLLGEITALISDDMDESVGCLSEAIERLHHAEVPPVKYLGDSGEAYGAIASQLFGADYALRVGNGSFYAAFEYDACGDAEKAFQLAQVMAFAGISSRSTDYPDDRGLFETLLAVTVAAHRVRGFLPDRTAAKES